MKMKFVNDFKQFAMRGNVVDMAVGRTEACQSVDMAVGIIIGGAFGKIVSSAVSDVIMPVVGLLIGGINFTDLKLTLHAAEVNAAGEVVTPAVELNYGNFIQASVDFLIIAFAIFCMIKLMAKFTSRQKEEKTATPPAPSEEVQVLTQIRDLLQKQKTE